MTQVKLKKKAYLALYFLVVGYPYVKIDPAANTKSR